MARTVVGLFDTFADAQSAVSELINAGFGREDISLVANNTTGDFDRVESHDGVNVSHGAGDAVKGAVRGGLYGGLTALAATVALALIPGIGPIAAIGPLSAFLGGATLGAAAGGIIGGLTGLGVPEHEAGYYAEGIRRGGTLVTVHAADMRADEAAAILNRYRAVDINARADYYRSTGYDSHSDTLPAYNAEQVAEDRARYASYSANNTAANTTGHSRYYDAP